jgi:ABC-type phosphate transport system substrate-binding protein
VKSKLLKLGIVGAALAVVGALVAGPAGAIPPSNYGFDDNAHVMVGGGSDTTFAVMQQLALDWQRSDYGNTGGCVISTATGPGINNCVANGSPETNDLGNWQHDTIAQANPAGSGAGIASLNAFNGTTYGGTVNGSNVDFARSSRGPKTSGGNCAGGNEKTCDTFWGYGGDGIEIVLFGARASYAQGQVGNGMTPLTATELFHIWNCDYTMWSQVPSLKITGGGPNDGPIVPWTMQTSSGTFATFQSYIQTNASGVPANWSPNGQSCDHKFANGPQAGNPPFENDLKPLINDPTTIGTTAGDPNNPINWIWWGSFGVLSTFPFLSQPVRGGTTYSTAPAPVTDIIPSQSNILAGTYPISRILFHVTRKADADCPLTGGSCDFPGNPGPTANTPGTADFNVTGGTSGVSGSVREFTRWLCRPDASHQQVNPYTGVNYFADITGALASSGFTVVPAASRTAGSRCDVIH